MKFYKDGFQLYPTVETFTISYLVRVLGDKAREVTSNKLERFIKEEISKPNLVGALLADLRTNKPMLYKVAEPTELQITFFLKSNAKKIKEALVKVGNVKPSPYKYAEVLEERVELEEISKPSIFNTKPKPVLKSSCFVAPVETKLTSPSKPVVKQQDSLKRQPPQTLEELTTAVQNAKIKSDSYPLTTSL